jgi:hypothetical protein
MLESAPNVVLIGDCIKPATIREAIVGGYYTGLGL